MFSNKTFKNTISFEDRKNQSEKILEKHDNKKVPIVSEICENNKNDISLDKHKFLVPSEITLAQFICVIRKRIKINPEDALFIYFNNVLPISSDTLGNIYRCHKDLDGFLYATIALENTFG